MLSSAGHSMSAHHHNHAHGHGHGHGQSLGQSYASPNPHAHTLTSLHHHHHHPITTAAAAASNNSRSSSSSNNNNNHHKQHHHHNHSSVSVSSVSGSGSGSGSGVYHYQLRPSPLSSQDNLPRDLQHLSAVQAVNTHYSASASSPSHSHPQSHSHSHSRSNPNLHLILNNSNNNSLSSLNLSLASPSVSTSALISNSSSTNSTPTPNQNQPHTQTQTQTQNQNQNQNQNPSPKTSTSISTSSSRPNGLSLAHAHVHANHSHSLSHPPPTVGALPPPPPHAQQHRLRRMPNLPDHQHRRSGSLSIPNSLPNNPTSNSKNVHSHAHSGSHASTPSAMPSINAIAAGPGPSRGPAGGPGPGGGPPSSAAAGAGGSQAGFDGPRSPPNTSHVPCKFFRQGACQAGAACPFSHDLGASAENVCKYFAKGNCKFGPKCANIHVLPDGRRVNYGKNGVTVTPLNFGSRLNPLAYGHQASNSALTTSFMRAEAAPPYTTYAAATSDDRYVHGLGRQASMDNGLPTIDTQYSGPVSPYGSPHAGEDAIRTGFGLSPIAVNKGLSVLDAPLPASFDSNGISHAARYGPWPASVPNKFGIESPTPSLSNAKDSRTSETLKMLHTSAFGSNEHLSPSHLGGDVDAMGSSPPMQPIGEEFYGRRAMHSSSSKYAKPRHLSASVPKVDRDWEDNFLFLEEDYVPGELANDLLTPAEKARRGSVRMIEGGSEQPSGENSASKYGSPIGSSSPSRWGPLFQRQKEEDGGQSALGRSLKSAGAFGHVGSPLRNSSLANGIDKIGGLNGRNSRPSLAGSWTASGGTDSLSALTQQIQNTRINDERTTSSSSSPHLHPGSAANTRQPSAAGAHAGAGVIGPSNGRNERDQRALERHISSGSIGSSANGRFTTPIDEEDPSFVFSMEDDDDGQKARKRISGGLGLGGAGGWSYAAAATGKTSAGNKSSAVETR